MPSRNQGGKGCTFPFSWRSTWSPAKKAYCCETEHRGCEGKGEASPFDCVLGLDNFRTGNGTGHLSVPYDQKKIDRDL